MKKLDAPTENILTAFEKDEFKSTPPSEEIWLNSKPRLTLLFPRASESISIIFA